MVISWITKVLSPLIARSVAFLDSSHMLWKELQDRYSEGDYFRYSDLLQAIHSLKQGVRSISDYFLHLQTLWQELEALRPIHQCICAVPCTCDLAKGVSKSHDNEYVICFLKGLTDTYDSVRRQILHSDPLPPIASVFAQIQQQERQESDNPFIDSKAQPTVLANSSKGQSSKGSGQAKGKTHSSSRGPSMKGKICEFCQRENHTVDVC
jgi:hypothetical protein